MIRVNQHGCDWRYSFNAKKSAVLVFGESARETRIGSTHRMFSLGGVRVKEKLFYDHVGIKTCVKGDTHVRTEEKVTKARKVLNMTTNIGIRKGGRNLKTCNVIYWTIVIPTLLFGCEIWLLKDRDMSILNAFQRYAARRLQRLHTRSLNATSCLCLGWMEMLNVIKARKIIFIRTIMVMEDYMPLKKITVERLAEFAPDNVNEFDSPLIQIFQYCDEYGLLEEVRQMGNGVFRSKNSWKKLVWDISWQKENERIRTLMRENRNMDLIQMVSPTLRYSVWWSIADMDQQYMRRCEIMVKLLCHASLLKGDDGRLRRKPFGSRSCVSCELAAYDCAKHLVMECPGIRIDMYREIDKICKNFGRYVVFPILMGSNITGWEYYDMVPIWLIACTYISRMYFRALGNP